MDTFVIIGASCAGLTAAERLRKLNPDAEIKVISEDIITHSRCMLHKYLSKERSQEGINFISEDFFDANRITWMGGKTVSQLKEVDHKVVLDDGEEVSYTKLLIASGSEYFVPPITNFRDAENVFGFRSLRDAKAIEEALINHGNRVVVVGGGLVGLDVTYGLLEQGAQVTLVEMENRLMPLQTDLYVAKRYQEIFEKAGCIIKTGIGVTSSEMDIEFKINQVSLSNGEILECDFVVVAVSVRPRIEFLYGTSLQARSMNYRIHNILSKYQKKTPINVNKGLEVNDCLQSNDPDVYAAGDVTGISSIWPDAKSMGDCAAYNMSGIVKPYTLAFQNKNVCNFFDLKMLSVGMINVDEEIYDVKVYTDGSNYKKAVLQDGKLMGMLILGDISHAGIYLYLIRTGTSVEGMEDRIFELSFADFYQINTTSYEFKYGS